MNLQVTKKILDLGKNLSCITGLLDPFFYKYNLSDKFKIKIAEPAVKKAETTKQPLPVRIWDQTMLLLMLMMGTEIRITVLLSLPY